MPTRSSINPKQMDDHLILYYRIDLPLLKKEGKKFKWIKLSNCPICKSVHIWGHGYVLRFIYKYPTGLWLKRYRCNDCGRVYTVRPDDYSLGQYYSRNQILTSIKNKIISNRWILNIPRQNQQYWYKALGFMALFRNTTLKIILDKLLAGEISFISKRERYYEIKSVVDPPYLSLAVKSSDSFITLHR